MTIKMEVIDDESQHFLVTFERPGRIEIMVVDGEVMASVYDGTKIDLEQEPLGVYDATMSAPFVVTGNESWESSQPEARDLNHLVFG